MKRLILAFLVVVLDQITKLVFTDKAYGIINYTTNTGMVFGLLKGYNFLFIVITIAVIIFIVYCLFKYNNLGFYFILGGAIGNLIDRLFFSFVRDFIDLKIWPIFNLADSFIVVGVVLIILEMWKGSYK